MPNGYKRQADDRGRPGQRQSQGHFGQARVGKRKVNGPDRFGEILFVADKDAGQAVPPSNARQLLRGARLPQQEKRHSGEEGCQRKERELLQEQATESRKPARG